MTDLQSAIKGYLRRDRQGVADVRNQLKKTNEHASSIGKQYDHFVKGLAKKLSPKGTLSSHQVNLITVVWKREFPKEHKKLLTLYDVRKTLKRCIEQCFQFRQDAHKLAQARVLAQKLECGITYSDMYGRFRYPPSDDKAKEKEYKRMLFKLKRLTAFLEANGEDISPYITVFDVGRDWLLFQLQDLYEQAKHNKTGEAGALGRLFVELFPEYKRRGLTYLLSGEEELMRKKLMRKSVDMYENVYKGTDSKAKELAKLMAKHKKSSEDIENIAALQAEVDVEHRVKIDQGKTIVNRPWRFWHWR